LGVRIKPPTRSDWQSANLERMGRHPCFLSFAPELISNPYLFLLTCLRHLVGEAGWEECHRVPAQFHLQSQVQRRESRSFSFKVLLITPTLSPKYCQLSDVPRPRHGDLMEVVDNWPSRLIEYPALQKGACLLSSRPGNCPRWACVMAQGISTLGVVQPPVHEHSKTNIKKRTTG